MQHLIEKCICYNMNKEECMETLEKHAKIMPVITSTGTLASCMPFLLATLLVLALALDRLSNTLTV